MVGRIVASRVDPREADADFWKRYHEFRRQRQADARPDDPVQPDAEEEKVLKRGDPFRLQERYEISDGGRIHSFFEGFAVAPTSPEYETSKHIYEADAYVVPARRREGIGTSWLRLVVERMNAHGCTTVGFWCDQEPAHEFMRWIGADAKLASIESRLDLEAVDWAMLQSWADDGPRRSPGTTLEIHDDGIPEAMWDEFAPRLSALLNTIPFESLEHGEIVITPERMRDFHDRMRLTGEVVQTAIAREADGSISGITEISWAPHRRSNLHQMFTGVDPAQRGRGLGKWIKAALLLRAREAHPDARYVVTDNAGSNAPMLKINRAMGFREYRRGVEYQITRDRLAARLAQLPA